MKSKQLNRNLYIIFTTLIIFAVGYYLYLEVYTRNKESHIIATKSRILEQMSKNLKVKINSLGTNTTEYVNYLLDLSKKNQYQSPEDSLYLFLKKRKDIQYYNANLEYVSSKKITNADPPNSDADLNVIPEAKTDFLYFNVVLGDKYKLYSKKCIQFKANYDALMADFKQRNIFNEYILIANNTIIYSSLPNKPNLAINDKGSAKVAGDDNNSVKEVSSGNIELINQSKSLQAEIKGVTNFDIDISNNSYKLFMCQTQVDNSTWYICGLVDSDEYNQARKGIAPWILILVFMVLSLIILGLPFIKLKVMSSTEQLTSGTLLNSAVSLFFGTSFIILFVFFGTNSFWYRNQNENRLNDLANEINDSLFAEIMSSSNQLDYYDHIGLKKMNSDKKLSDSDNILSKKDLKPVSYPYFDYIFWIEPNGMQTGLLTPFPKVDNPSNLSNRDYFNKPDEWILPNDNTHRFRMESIVSVTSGIVKVALSKQSEINNRVIAMTGRFHSIIEPLLPGNFKFCIIDKSGLVWFHSDKLRNLQENLITECSGDKNLSAAIFANASTTMDVDYYDEPYRLTIRPLTPMPLYLVTMIDKQGEYSYQVQVLMLNLLLFSALVLFILIQTMAFYLLKSFGKRAGWKNLILDFFGAKGNQNKIYIVMSILFVLVTFLFFILTNPVNVINPLLFVLVMICFLFPYLNYAINKFSLKLDGRNLYALLNILFLFLINASAFKFLTSNDMYKLWIFQGALILLLVLGFFVLQQDFKLKTRSNNIVFYVLFLMALLLVFSVAPSIKFFEASVNHEIIRGAKHDQLKLAMQRDARNGKLRNYYKLMEQNDTLDPSVERVFINRMERGIYSSFVGSRFHVQGKESWGKMDPVCVEYAKRNKVHYDYIGENIINIFRPVYDRTSIETKYLERDYLMSGNQSWSLCKDFLIFDYTSTNEKYVSHKPDSCRIISKIDRPYIFDPFSNDKLLNKLGLFQGYDIFFILILLLIYFSIYFIIHFGTRRLLGISILEMHTAYNFGNFLCERIASGHSVLVLGSPFINLSAFIEKKLMTDFNVSKLDLANPEIIIVPEKNPHQNNVLVIENFASDYYSHVSLELQINKIQEKFRNNERMIIISATSPHVIKEYLELKVSQKSDGKDNSEVTNESWEQLLYSFNHILANVNTLYTPEKYNDPVNHHECYSSSECKPLHDDYVGDHGENLRCLICRELEASTYLQRYSNEMQNFYNKLVEMEIPAEIMKDRIIARIMDLSRLYYDTIFASCSPMELFVLSDMAQDMIVNSKNKKVVVLLINRGLFVVNGCSIRFMNESFRKHVILRFTHEEKAKLKVKLGDTGTNWQGYKLFLILIMIGLFSFLFIANRAFLDNLNKLFLVIGGGTVLITNLTGFITRKENSNTK